MRRYPSAFRRLLLLAATLAPIPSTAVETGVEKPGRGGDRPTLVFQAGLGDDSSTWTGLLPALRPDFAPITLDRAGYGDQPIIEGARRDPCAIAREQHERLAAMGLRPPYILVGHSLGGLYQYVYARLYPEDVTGVVLIDPTAPGHWELVQEHHPALATALETMLSVAAHANMRDEFRQQTDCLETIAMDRPLDTDVRILVSGRIDSMDNEAYASALRDSRGIWKDMTGAARLETLWDAGHYIHHERPDAVVDAIYEVAGRRAPPRSRQPDTPLPGEGSLMLRVGATPRAAIEAALGRPTEVHRDRDGSVLIYTDAKLDVPILIGFIPVLGDVLDLAATAQDLLKVREEWIFQFDAQGILRRHTQRAVP
ncbi:MAG: alpha/beta hydrolase [Pseudomonadota bacterium]